MPIFRSQRQAELRLAPTGESEQPSHSSTHPAPRVTFGPETVIGEEFDLTNAEQVLIDGSWAERYHGTPVLRRTTLMCSSSEVRVMSRCPEASPDRANDRQQAAAASHRRTSQRRAPTPESVTHLETAGEIAEQDPDNAYVLAYDAARTPAPRSLPNRACAHDFRRALCSRSALVLSSATGSHVRSNATTTQRARIPHGAWRDHYLRRGTEGHPRRRGTAAPLNSCRPPLRSSDCEEREPAAEGPADHRSLWPTHAHGSLAAFVGGRRSTGDRQSESRIANL